MKRIALRLEMILLVIVVIWLGISLVVAQPDSAACKNAIKRGENLQRAMEAAEELLADEICQGPGRSLCVSRIRQLQEQLRINAEQVRVACSPDPRTPAQPCPVRPREPRSAPVILEIQSLSGTVGYKNPDFDTSSHAWSKTICGAATWLSGYNPRYEWTPILSPTRELEDADVAASGIAINAHRSMHDIWFTHPFGKDLNFDLAPDPMYMNLASPILKPDPDPEGRDNSICKARTEFGLDINNVLHVEIDSGFVPAGHEPQNGDRVAVLGRWIVDCGHDDYGAEIHPPLLMFMARPSGVDATSMSVISRPFLVSQEYGDGGLYEHLVKQLFRVYPPLLPFPLTDQVEARPERPLKPFSGIKLFNVVIRPPSPRRHPKDQLLVSYQLSARNGVAVKLYNVGDDAVGLAVVLNDIDYNVPDLPKKRNLKVTKKEITEERKDIGDLIFHFQGAGSSLAQPFGAIVLEKGVDTDAYDMLTGRDPAPVSTSVSQVDGIRIQPDDSQPWPIRGHVTVQWKRAASGPAIFVLPARVVVPANVLWVDSGITLKQGQGFTIRASGLWSNTGPPALGPNGFSGTLFPGTLFPSASLGSLIGRVGDQMFAIGEALAGTSPRDGKLFLAINDTPSTFADNEGELIVMIRVH
ncbi:MAG: LecA/PA-IL family lectin [Pyrinomonadaceae bacterium]